MIKFNINYIILCIIIPEKPGEDMEALKAQAYETPKPVKMIFILAFIINFLFINMYFTHSFIVFSNDERRLRDFGDGHRYRSFGVS